MKTKIKNQKPSGLQSVRNRKHYLQGYPLYPARKDLYNKYDKEEDLNKIEEPDDIVKSIMNNENDQRNDLSDSDSYIPNSDTG